MRRGQSVGPTTRRIKAKAEMETLIRPAKDELGRRHNPKETSLRERCRSQRLGQAPDKFRRSESSWVHRLREVMAQVGFTVFEAVRLDITAERGGGRSRRASCSRDHLASGGWNRGEGISSIKKTLSKNWATRTRSAVRAVTRPAGRLRGLEGRTQWRATKKFVEEGGLFGLRPVSFLRHTC